MRKVLINAYACSLLERIGWSWAINVVKKGYDVWCITNFEDKQATRTEHRKVGLPNLQFEFVTFKYRFDTFFFNPSSKMCTYMIISETRACLVALKLHAKINFDDAHYVSKGSFQQGT